MPTFFKVSENWDAQKQILHSWRNEITSIAQCIISKSLTVKQFLCVCIQYILDQSLKYF